MARHQRLQKQNFIIGRLYSHCSGYGRNMVFMSLCLETEQSMAIGQFELRWYLDSSGTRQSQHKNIHIFDDLSKINETWIECVAHIEMLWHTRIILRCQRAIYLALFSTPHVAIPLNSNEAVNSHLDDFYVKKKTWLFQKGESCSSTNDVKRLAKKWEHISFIDF